MKLFFKKNKRGMTLIEVLVAMLLFSLIFIGILPNFLVLGYSTIFTMGGKTQAVAEANEIMDSIFMSGQAPAAAIAALSVTTNQPYTATWTTIQNPADPSKNLYKVTVTTQYWDNDAQELKSVTIESIMPMSAP